MGYREKKGSYGFAFLKSFIKTPCSPKSEEPKKKRQMTRRLDTLYTFMATYFCVNNIYFFIFQRSFYRWKTSPENEEGSAGLQNKLERFNRGMLALFFWSWEGMPSEENVRKEAQEITLIIFLPNRTPSRHSGGGYFNSKLRKYSELLTPLTIQ